MTLKQPTSKSTGRKVLSANDRFRVVLRQTPAKDIFHIVKGDDCENAAVTMVEQVLASGGLAFILKRDRAFAAPEKPVATEIDFGATE
ncbi:MAG: hypothetical protein L3J33_03305 [Rhodobacteraceae bacterium]|nr:hypothetical protein [Paracoccaceae bacterium]